MQIVSLFHSTLSYTFLSPKEKNFFLNRNMFDMINSSFFFFNIYICYWKPFTYVTENHSFIFMYYDCFWILNIILVLAEKKFKHSRMKSLAVFQINELIFNRKCPLKNVPVKNFNSINSSVLAEDQKKGQCI